MRSVGWALAAGLAAMSCNSSGIQGGWIGGLRPERDRIASRGTTQSVFSVQACHDVAGQPLEVGGSRVTLIQLDATDLLLVEHSADYPPLYVENYRLAGVEHVFSVALKSHDGPPTLREYRFGANAAGAGRLRVVDDWRHEQREAGEFVAHYDRPVIECALVPADAPSPVHLGAGR